MSSARRDPLSLSRSFSRPAGSARETRDARDPALKRERPAPVPNGLVARTFEAAGDEFVVFSWGGERLSEPSPDEPRATVATPPAPPRAPLSSAEQAVLEHVVRGASNRDIAVQRGVSERTIANQVAAILRKLGARSRFELIRRYPAA